MKSFASPSPPLPRCLQPFVPRPRSYPVPQFELAFAMLFNRKETHSPTLCPLMTNSRISLPDISCRCFYRPIQLKNIAFFYVSSIFWIIITVISSSADPICLTGLRSWYARKGMLYVGWIGQNLSLCTSHLCRELYFLPQTQGAAILCSAKRRDAHLIVMCMIQKRCTSYIGLLSLL